MNDKNVILSGTNPKLLLLSGMHGDEYEVIDAVTAYVKSYKRRLPSFLYIPEVSPSAVARRKRRNQWGHDVNRSFFDPPRDEEVRRTTEILLPYQFNLAINFHEDPDFARVFYLYDSGQLLSEHLSKLRALVVTAGAGLHTGTDDPMDANLGYHVEKGYISTPYDSLPQNVGFSWVWFAKHKIAKRNIDVEIPGKAPMDLKARLVDIVFFFFLTPEFGF